MSTVQEIEAAIPRLSRAELEQFQAWFENYLEDHLELTDEVKAWLEESRRESPLVTLISKFFNLDNPVEPITHFIK